MSRELGFQFGDHSCWHGWRQIVQLEESLVVVNCHKVCSELKFNLICTNHFPRPARSYVRHKWLFELWFFELLHTEHLLPASWISWSKPKARTGFLLSVSCTLQLLNVIDGLLQAFLASVIIEYNYFLSFEQIDCCCGNVFLKIQIWTKIIWYLAVILWPVIQNNWFQVLKNCIICCFQL